MVDQDFVLANELVNEQTIIDGILARLGLVNGQVVTAAHSIDANTVFPSGHIIKTHHVQETMGYDGDFSNRPLPYATSFSTARNILSLSNIIRTQTNSRFLAMYNLKARRTGAGIYDGLNIYLSINTVNALTYKIGGVPRGGHKDSVGFYYSGADENHHFSCSGSLFFNPPSGAFTLNLLAGKYSTSAAAFEMDHDGMNSLTLFEIAT